ncbi:hypothetical protein ACIBEJ_04485 [Nonomuraea sp. NPDC050790]|uniref:hypothetical protein n=1 Tax=Nonomuraea sp. NPDC050790 TaxID=3364371 RepID=UPI0037A4B4C1
MRHTESNLRTLLDQRSHDAAGRVSLPRLDEIVRRGRRTRLTRRALGAAAALTAATAAVLLTVPAQPERAVVAAQTPASAGVETPPRLPERYAVVLGAEKFSLSLIASRHFDTTGVVRTMTFTPTSVFTGFKVVCADPQAWVVVSTLTKSGERSGTSGRCGNGGGGHHDRRSAPSGWLKGPQTVQVWVFPPDAPVVRVAEELGHCRRLTEDGTCDERMASAMLPRKDVLERLFTEVGERPGAWAIGAYDRPSSAGRGESMP